jgi:hypothetical protein
MMLLSPPGKSRTAARCDALIGTTVVSNCRCAVGMKVPVLAVPGAATAASYTIHKHNMQSNA